MRWRRVGVGMAVAGGLAALGLWALRDKAGPPPTEEAARAPEPPSPPAQAPLQPQLGGGSIAGKVIRRGAAVPAARVVARDELTATDVAADGSGAFVFNHLEPGRYWVSAALGNEASALAGPILLGPTDKREGLVLELLPAGTVRGAVYDAVTRSALQGAVVRTSGGTSVTDEAGRFTLRGLPVGETWIDAAAKGYAQRTEWLTLDAARELAGMELFLRPAGRVTGTVRRTGKPLAGATVWAEVAGLANAERSFGPTTSSADGTYQLSVEAGALHLAAAAPNGARVEGPALTLGEGEGKQGVDIDVGEGLEAGGVVRIGGHPVEGATLWVLDGKTQRMAAMANTFAGGRFQVGGLASGSYLVQVQRGAVAAQRGPFAISESGAEWSIDIEDGSTLTGTVEPAKAGTLVHWRSTDWAGPVPAETATDAAGRFRFDSVAAGSLWVEAQGEAGAARVQAKAGTEVHLKLVPAILRGLVVDDAGHAVTDFTVRLTPVSGGSQRSYPVLSPTGDFRFPVPPGTYEVSATATGYGETGERPRVEVQSGETSVKLALQASTELSGRVIDAATRAPLTGAQVIIFRMPFGAGRWATLATDGSGTFHLSAAPKSGFVEVRKEGYQPALAPVDRLARGPDGKAIEVPLSPGNDDAPGTHPYEGVGLQLDFRGGVKVASVFEGGPAEQAGVLTGDLLLAADGQPLAGLSGQDVTARIMGPSGTVVRLSVQRGDETFDLYVRRRSIQF